MNKNKRKKGSSGSFRGNNRRGKSRSFGINSFGYTQEMHKAVCDNCKKECEVPFKPIKGKPIYCKECYSRKKSGF